MDLFKSMLDLNYPGFYCFMVKEKLWEKYFKFTDLNSITHTDSITKNNKMSITSTFFQAKEDININKKDGIPLFDELHDIYYSLIKKNQLKTYMILKTNLGELNIELWSTRLTETVEKIYNIIYPNQNKINKINYMQILDDEFLILDELKIDIKIEKDKNTYINKSDIYIIGTIFNKEEKEENEENILDIYFNKIKNEKNNEIIVEKIDIINNPFVDMMKEILFQEIKEKYLVNINNDEINKDIKIMKLLEKNQDEINNKKDKNVGKYLNKKRNNDINYDTLKKFINNEC